MNAERPLYRVTASREDGLWVAIVDDVPAGATDVERVAELDDAVRDLVATYADLEPEDFNLEWCFQ